MKKILYFSIILFTTFLYSCEYDNYEAPTITFNGNLTYNGNKCVFDGNPGFGMLTLVQKGFGKVDPGTNVRISENGSFNQLIFPGDYWLTLANNPYPFEFKDFKSKGVGLGYDSIPMKITGNVTKDIEVTPFFQISNFTLSISSGNVVASFKVKKTTGTVSVVPRVIRARCFMSTSAIVNSSTTFSKQLIKSIPDSANVSIPMSISTGTPSYRSMYVNNFRDYAYCRVALELYGIPNYYLFSETLKVEGLPQ